MSMEPFNFDVSKYPALPRAKGFFVTGTDTEVGKTIIAGAIARQLRRIGRAVEVFKPVATGCRRELDALVSADGEFLAACCDSKRRLADIVPLRYVTAVSPNVAALREHRPIDLDAMFAAYWAMVTDISSRNGVAVVEGVGGLLCPISDDFWVIHLAKMTQLPLVIVARAGLGTINHTLLTLHAARTAGVEVAGVIVNRYRLEPQAGDLNPQQAGEYFRGDEDMAMFTNPQQIAARGKVALLAIVPDEPTNSVENVTIGPDTEFAISQVDWQKMLK